jgi:hypothetical protein
MQVAGAPALMSVPGAHITWQDDTTLKVDTDAGSRRDCCARQGGHAGCAADVAGRLAGAVADAALARAAAVRPADRPRTHRHPVRAADRRKSSPKTCAPDTCERTVPYSENA